MHLYLAFLILCAVESSNGTAMQNHDDPLCIGWTQMRPIAVRDCNRICRLKDDPRRFKLADRYNKAKCYDMFEVLVTYYLGDTPSMRSIALLWCRGNATMGKPLTDKSKEYLVKVRKELKDRGLTAHYNH